MVERKEFDDGLGTGALREVLEARLAGMDKAIVLLQAIANGSPTIGEVVVKQDERFKALSSHLEAALLQLKELYTEKIGTIKSSFDEKLVDSMNTITVKFDSIATQFRERDVRTEQLAKDSKIAVDAALQAAKEAVGEQNKSNALSISKSEAAFTKQIDQIGLIINSQAKNVDDKIDDLKARLIDIGQVAQKNGGGSTQISIIISIVSMVIVLGSIIGFAIFARGQGQDELARSALQSQINQLIERSNLDHPTPPRSVP